MKIILKNIGMLKKAELNIDYLTVIAGENDNGKSTVGKVIFCIIKAMNRYKEDLQESKEYKINEKLESIFFLIRRTLGDLENKSFLDSQNLYNLLDSQNLYTLLDSEINIDEKINYLETLVQMIKKSNNIDLKNLNRLEKLSEEAISIIKEPENIQKSIENALNKVFLSEFDSSILLDGEEEGFISLYENALKLIDIKVTKDNRIHLLDNIEPIEIKDATFIESPLILNNHDLLIRSQSGLNLNKRNIDRLGIPYTTLHTKDLFDKLKKLSFNIFFEDDFEEIFRKEIFNIVNGEIVYDSDKKDFVYRKDNKVISIKNTASGIKSFGIVQLLILNGVINSNSILILDEPENHLHPKWQLKFAKILTEIAKNNIYILVTSHSPYMIEALKRYSENTELKEKTNFYLAENKFINNEDRLGDIFSILSEPFEVFRRMDEELLKDE